MPPPVPSSWLQRIGNAYAAANRFEPDALERHYPQLIEEGTMHDH
jgi:hypothetical protein